jgi:hypothetical protein
LINNKSGSAFNESVIPSPFEARKYRGIENVDFVNYGRQRHQTGKNNIK